MTNVSIVKRMASYFDREYPEVLIDIVRAREDMKVTLANIYLEEKEKQRHIHKGGIYYNIAISHLIELQFGEAKAHLELAINEDKIYYKGKHQNAPASKLYTQLFPEGEVVVAARVINILEEIIKDKISSKREKIIPRKPKEREQE